MIQTEEGDLSNYVSNGEWDLIRIQQKRNVVYYSCCLEPYPDITYFIVLRRRPLFYGMFLETMRKFPAQKQLSATYLKLGIVKNK